MVFANKFRTLMMAAAFVLPATLLPVAQAHAGVFISVGFAPPVLPVYAQPPIPAEGYIWTPGYWAYGDAGYYWVPGVWVEPPTVGVLWTPPYWGFAGGAYGFHPGYWGPHVGFYGGVNYGFGYGGVGFGGGLWVGGRFSYNSAVCNFGGVHVTNVYVNRTVINASYNHASFNGPGGWQAHPTPQQQMAENEHHFGPTANQVSNRTFAGQDRSQLAAFNHGRPGTPAARDISSYHQVTQQHAQAHPITSADRSAGSAYHPDAREGNQDQRISNGLRSGQMTSGEAARADSRQSAIDNQVRNDRSANGGALTGQERRQVNREQNGASRQIYNENHNGNTVAPNAVDNREANQQQRTAQGLRSGQETSGEAARTNARQAGVDQQVHNERTANGGALNQQQRRQANRQENRNSSQINKQKHNDDRREPPK